MPLFGIKARGRGKGRGKREEGRKSHKEHEEHEEGRGIFREEFHTKTQRARRAQRGKREKGKGKREKGKGKREEGLFGKNFTQRHKEREEGRGKRDYSGRISHKDTKSTKSTKREEGKGFWTLAFFEEQNLGS
jgi:hypothetical protein